MRARRRRGGKDAAPGTPSAVPCVICMSDCITRFDHCKVCKDTFVHAECVLPWVVRRGTCPTCRGWLIEVGKGEEEQVGEEERYDDGDHHPTDLEPPPWWRDWVLLKTVFLWPWMFFAVDVSMTFNLFLWSRVSDDSAPMVISMLCLMLAASCFSHMIVFVRSLTALQRDDLRSQYLASVLSGSGEAEGESEGAAEGESEGAAEGESEGAAEGESEGESENVASFVPTMLTIRLRQMCVLLCALLPSLGFMLAYPADADPLVFLMLSYGVLFWMSILAALGTRPLWRLNYLCTTLVFSSLMMVSKGTEAGRLSVAFAMTVFSSLLCTMMTIVTVF
jgi:hypothetical protein